MRTVVSKFGGSSTANAQCFRRIRRILDLSPARRCVVLSAPGIDGTEGEKVTALLLRLWHSRTDSREYSALAGKVAGRFRRIASELGLADPTPLVLEELERAAGISEAHLVSRGEYLCASLFSSYSGLAMVDAAQLVAFDAGSRLDAEATLKRFGEAASRHKRFVVPGFYGADGSGCVHTFPRNGSDITGALAAAGVGAALYENWTDVPGLMTADPAVVPEARLIPQVSYRQMRRLARAGARVLHPACLDPVAAEGIPTRLRGFSCPECFGTLIDDRCSETVPCLSGEEVAVLPSGMSLDNRERSFDAPALGSVPAENSAEPSTLSRAVSRVDAFGLPESRVRQAAKPLDPICFDVHGDRCSVFVPRERFAPAMRALHRALLA